MPQELEHFINGKRVKGTSGRFGDVYNPATGEVIRQTPLANAAEVRAAVENSKEAFATWSHTPPARRAQVMFKYRDLLIKNMDEIAELVSSEHGKTLDDAKGSIGRGLEVVEFACGIPHLLKGEFTEAAANGVDVHSTRQALGVCAGITPFNFPAMVPMWMFPMALATGNTFILKPSERDPSCPIRLAELMIEAGLPAGVLNVVNGDKEAVDALLTDPDVKAISFVGSTQIGRYIYSTGCANDKRVQALCGAKNHMVIMPDADMDQVVDAAMGAAYGSAGERCMAISVAVPVGEDTANRFIEALAPRVRDLKVGPYNDPATEMGPVVTREAQQKILGLVETGIAQGANLVVDGREVNLQGYENGFFVGGCLFDNVTTDMDIYKEEIFGPVLATVRSKSYDDAITMINDHAYGNGTAIFTRDGGAARQFCEDAPVGMVGVNVPIPVPVGYHSFGGWKDSLFGDTHMYGPEGIRFYTKAQAITSRWPDPASSSVDLGFPRND